MFWTQLDIGLTHSISQVLAQSFCWIFCDKKLLCAAKANHWEREILFAEKKSSVSLRYKNSTNSNSKRKKIRRNRPWLQPCKSNRYIGVKWEQQHYGSYLISNRVLGCCESRNKWLQHKWLTDEYHSKYLCMILIMPVWSFNSYRGDITVIIDVKFL